jgi:putative transposase
MVVCDGLKGLPDAIAATWPLAVIQTCVIHLLRPHSATRAGSTGTPSPRACGRFIPRLPSRPRRLASTSSRKPGATSTRRSSGSGTNAWAEFVPFLAFDAEIRTVVCSTNAIESVNARIRRAVRARGHFPNEAAALKCVYLAVMSRTRPAKAANAGRCAGNQH